MDTSENIAPNSQASVTAPAPEPERQRSTHLNVPIIPMIESVLFPRTYQPLTLQGEQAESIARSAIKDDGLVALFMQHATVGDAEPTPDDLAPIGTLARLNEVTWADDGTIQLVAEGMKAVRRLSVTQWQPHVEAVVEAIARPQEDASLLASLCEQTRRLYTELISRDPQISATLGPLLQNAHGGEELAFLIASTVPISPAARQTLLETQTLSAVYLTLISYLNKAVELKGFEHASGGDSADNGRSATQARHFDPATLDRIALEEKLRKGNPGPEVMEAALRELERLNLVAPTSPDYNMTRQYVQWLADLPWSGGQDENLDLERAAAVLDRDHFGLDEIKQRILEHLAVRKLRSRRGTDASNHSSEPPRQPVLCLVGPPGVGKTSLGRSIAAALGRPFERISLGGVSDEADIRGHRRTYLGAMPGRIIQSLTRTASNTPLIMLDELDKLGKDSKGDPSAALLDVLDPEQQSAFVDHYIGLPFDLSCVFFIATANTLDGVPGALRDRLEVIRLAGYTEEEKLSIANRHLIPRQLEWHALGPADVTWDAEAARTIVRNYTREAGVRQLDREIATVCRRIAALVAQEGEGNGTPRTPYFVNADFVTETLGTPRFLPAEPLDTDQPGVATGAFWTPVGGDLMHIEAIMMPGGKTLTITGQLGDVMKESAQAALSYVRSRAEGLGIQPDFFDRNDIHLHIPSGAVAKDGPSAGVALAVALVSLLTGIAVPGDLAMTGELTLRGKILPVGGIKEKVLAARRAGINHFLIPAQNRPDLDSVPPEMLSGLSIIEADHMDDALAAAFGGALR